MTSVITCHNLTKKIPACWEFLVFKYSNTFPPIFSFIHIDWVIIHTNVVKTHTLFWTVPRVMSSVLFTISCKIVTNIDTMVREASQFHNSKFPKNITKTYKSRLYIVYRVTICLCYMLCTEYPYVYVTHILAQINIKT